MAKIASLILALLVAPVQAQNYSAQLCPDVRNLAELVAHARDKGVPQERLTEQVKRADLDKPMQDLSRSVIFAAYAQTHLKPWQFASMIDRGCQLHASRK